MAGMRSNSVLVLIFQGCNPTLAKLRKHVPFASYHLRKPLSREKPLCTERQLQRIPALALATSLMSKLLEL